jgi:hypothetical protein
LHRDAQVLSSVTRELLRRTATKVDPATVRKALREAGIDLEEVLFAPPQ